jgi:hypothetical protein
MSPFEIRLELLKLANAILHSQATKPEFMPQTEEVIVHAEKLNLFVSQKS